MSDWTIEPIEPYGQGVGVSGDPDGYLLGVPLASFLQRLAAGLIDYIAPFVLVPLVMQRILGIGDTITLIVLFAVVVANTIGLQSTTGQSYGKKALGLQLAWPIWHEGSSDPSLAKVHPLLLIGRVVSHVIDWPLTVGWGYLRPLRHARRQTFADQVIKTVVIADTDIVLENWPTKRARLML